jgi:hypothetical protein
VQFKMEPTLSSEVARTDMDHAGEKAQARSLVWTSRALKHLTFTNPATLARYHIVTSKHI